MRRATRETSTRYAQPYRPAPIAIINDVARKLGRLGLQAFELRREEELLERARQRTKLHDFGDESFRDPLRRLLSALNAEAELHPFGRFMARENLLRVLGNRLKMEADLARHPEILALELEPPIFITGLQRTGTTVVQRLFAADPGTRMLASWEAINIAPLAPPRGDGKEPRRRMARVAETMLRFMAPDFFAIHPVEADSPEEDCLLMDYSFLSTVPEATQQVPSFSSWLESIDHEPAYVEHQRALKYLHWQKPSGPFVLKSPQHLEHLDALFAVYPEARVIWLHRDPMKTVASFCSMMSHAYGVFSDDVDPEVVGRRWLEKTSFMIERAMETREKLGDDAFIDVYYPELIADPMAEMRRIYESLGRPLTGLAKSRMSRWLEQNPQHKHGVHRYRLESFGLDEAEIDEAFAAYRKRFDIHEEDQR